MRLAAATGAAALLVAALGSPAAATGRASVVQAVYVGAAPALDVPADESGWSTAVAARDFRDFATHGPAALPTLARLELTADALYVGFVASEPPARIVARQRTNGVGEGGDDTVTVYLDTSGDGNRIYEFSATPAGVRYQHSSESVRYTPPWSATAGITGGGWWATMRIPLVALHSAAGNDARAWRFNFARHVAATNDDFTWASDPGMGAIGDSQWWPLLEGIVPAGSHVRPPARVDPFVLGTGAAGHDVFVDGLGAPHTRAFRKFGLDLTYPVTPTFALVATVAPDFSNVEVDQQTVAPQEFRRGLAEYRPFFAQGAAYLEPGFRLGLNGTANTMLYTPALAVVDSGLKLEGTLGASALGVLDAKGAGFDDVAFGYQRSSFDQALKLNVKGVIARHPGIVDQTIGAGFQFVNPKSGLGAAAEYERESGTLIGDARAAGSLDGALSFTRANVQVLAGYRDIGPQFAPLDGYTQQNDVRGPFGLVDLHRAFTGPVKSASLLLYGDRFRDRGGAVHQADVLSQLVVTFRNLFSLDGGPSSSSLRTYDQPYPVYAGAQDVRFDAHAIGLGYRVGGDSPWHLGYAFGPFGIACAPGSAAQSALCTVPNAPALVQGRVDEFSLTHSQTIGGGYAVDLLLDGVSERGGGAHDGQWLRRVAITRALGRDASFSLAARSIAGQGGFASPGTNLSASLFARLSDRIDLYFVYGSPATPTTLQRLVLKFVFHAGARGGG